MLLNSSLQAVALILSIFSITCVFITFPKKAIHRFFLGMVKNGKLSHCNTLGQFVGQLALIADDILLLHEFYGREQPWSFPPIQRYVATPIFGLTIVLLPFVSIY